MRMLSAVLDNKTNSGPARLEKQSHAINKRDSFFVAKYASLGQSHRLIIKVIKYHRNSYKLKWPRSCVVFSRHTNLQEKLLGISNGKFVEELLMQTLVCTLATVHKSVKSMKSAPTATSTSRAALPEAYTKFRVMLINCNCFYIGQSQRCIKTRIQEHIGEVTKLYNKHILLPNRTSTTPPPAHL
jgi:hypothetical protein